jgi:AraC-like DNA-binding protein
MFLKYITLFSGLNYLIFSAVLLLRKSPVKKANRVLGFLFAMLAVYSIMLSFYYTALLNKNYSHLIYYAPFDLIILFSLGPCLYLYVNVLLGHKIRLNPFTLIIQIIPFVPALIFIVYFLFQDTPTRLNLLIENFEHGIWHTNLLNQMVYFQMIIYLILSYKTIQKQFKKSSRIIVQKIQIDVSWLRIYVLVNLLFMTLSAPLSFYLANEKVNLIIAQLAMVVQFVYLFVKSTWQTEFFPESSTCDLKYKEGILKISEEVVTDYFKKLMSHMENEKPYLDEDCNIQTISVQTGIPVHHLSNILNQHFEKNFPDFVNEYRINEAKMRLTTNRYNKITLEAIGYDCGFGSKSSFNKAFKKHTKLTPSEYRFDFQNKNSAVNFN